MATHSWWKPFSLARLNVFALLVDQFKFLRGATSNKPAILVRAIVLLVGPVTGLTSFFLGWTLQSVGDLVGALGLLAGVFLSAFAIVFGLRSSLRRSPSNLVERKSARLMDESALTLLAAGLLAGVDAMWLGVVSASIPAAEGWTVSVVATAITVGISSLVAVYFLLSVRRLHVLYTDTFVPSWRVQRVAHHGEAREPMTAKEQAADIQARRRA
jgi:hypothetical protein